MSDASASLRRDNTAQHLDYAESYWRLGPEIHVSAPRGSLLADAIEEVFDAMAVPELAGPGSRVLSLDLKRIDRRTWMLYANGLKIVRMNEESEIAPTVEGTLVGVA